MLRIICIFVLLWAAPAPAADDHRYTVAVDAGLASLTVTARFAHPVSRIAARDGDAGRYLDAATDCDSGQPLSRRGRRLELPQRGIRCLHYVVDLDRAARADRRNEHLATRNVVVSPADWLWRPRIDGDSAITLRFVSDDHITVSVPWQKTGDGRYRLGPSPQSGKAVTAFGEFRYAEREVGGSVLRIALLTPAQQTPEARVDGDAFERWLVDTALNVVLTYGRFPHPSPQVLVVPSGRRGASPVPYGRVLRDGGETVELFVNDSRPLSEFYDDWTATHEFSHLLLPYVTIRQRWVSEGFAQYYQNVLLARAGIYTPERAWRKLYEGLERGRRSGRGLSPNAASANGIGAALMKVYWSGASIALMADVELRRRSGGAESLDTLLDRLQDCCLPSARVWTAAELFETLDSLAGRPVFMPLYRRYADAPGFPDYRPVFALLGLETGGHRLRLADDAELAGIRKEIMTISPSGGRRASTTAGRDGGREAALD